jgi:predicted nucleic acid-binding protein
LTGTGSRQLAVVVPALWQLEVVHVLPVGERRGGLTPADAASALRALEALPIEMAEGSGAKRLLRTAGQFGLSAYDAAYLEVAMRPSLLIASLDQHPARVAREAGVSLIE